MSDPESDSSIATADIRLFETGNLADATIVCGDRTWKVHKVILGSRCKWFHTAFYGKFAEAASGKVVLYEQDADLIDILLRFIYTKDIDIPKLMDGKDMPGFCVRIFRVGDFFLLEDLKKKATAEVEAQLFEDNCKYFGRKFYGLNTVDGQDPPEWLTEILNALEDGYKDSSTEPIVEPLLKFVHLKRHKIFKFKRAIALVDKVPEIARDLMKRYLAGDMGTQPQSPKFRLGLPVTSAIGSPDQIFQTSAANIGPRGSSTMPCLLYPVVGSSPVFTVAHQITDQEIDGLAWIVPCAHRVKSMLSHESSEIVAVKLHATSSSKPWLYIRFDSCGDATVYVERYHRANPEIEASSATSPTALSGAMHARLAIIAGRS